MTPHELAREMAKPFHDRSVGSYDHAFRCRFLGAMSAHEILEMEIEGTTEQVYQSWVQDTIHSILTRAERRSVPR